MKFKKAVTKTLIEEVVGVQDDYGGGYSSFEEDGPPTASIEVKVRGAWLWVTSRADYEGRTWDPSTDRLSGDPYSAHVNHDWIGEKKTAPKTVSHLKELYDWALLHVGYNREYTDVGSWGVHSGRWVDDVSSDGVIKLRVQSSRTFHDVSPVAETGEQQVDLSIFKNKSFERLIEMLQESNLFVREIAATLLGRLGDIRAVDPFLIDAIDDESQYVQEMVIKALGMIGGEKAIEKLTTILIESKYSPRSSVTHALAMTGEAALDSLIPAIRSENERVSISTVGIMKEIGGEKAIKILHDFIDTDRPGVSSAIIQAIGHLGGAVFIESLIKKLLHEDKDVQRSAAKALGILGDKRAIVPLIDTLIADHKWVREEAANALEILEWIPSTPEETARHHFARAEWDKLIKMRDEAVETILRALADSEEYYRGVILDPLAKSGVKFTDTRIADSIIEIYTETGEDYRRRDAATALRCVPIPKTIKFLMKEYLGLKSRYIRSRVEDTITSLALSGVDMSKELVSLLRRRKLEKVTNTELKYYFLLFKVVAISQDNLKSIKNFLQSVAKRKLNKETKKIISDLLKIDKILTDFLTEGSNRRESVKKLGDIGLPVAISLVLEALADGDFNVRENACSALGKMGDGAVPKVIEALSNENYRIRLGAAKALGSFNIRHNEAVKALLEALKDKHPIVRQNVAWALGEVGTRGDEEDRLTGRVIKALTKAMRTDEYLPVRLNAVHALAAIGDERAAEPLLEVVDSPAWEFRLNATWGFIKLSQFDRVQLKTRSQIIDKLIAKLSDERDRVRYNAVDGLRLFGGEKALAAVSSFQDDTDPEMRELVERAIEEIKSMLGRRRSSWSYSVRRHYELREPEVIEELIQQLRDEDEAVQLDAQRALGTFGQLAFDRLLGILQDENEHCMLRDGAAGALGRIGDRRAIDTLIRTLKDDNELVRCNSAWALAEMPDKSILKPLLDATRDEFWMVRLNAAAGIGKIGGRVALDRLLKMVDDAHPKVRWIVTSYIAQFKSPRVLPALRARLEDEDADVRAMAQQWIDELKKRAKK